MLFWPIFGDYWCPVATMVTFSSTLINFERNPPKKNEKIQKKIQKSKNLKKIKKSQKIFKKILLFFFKIQKVHKKPQKLSKN